MGLLLTHYGPQHWWPAEHPFEMATGAYCTYIASDDICHPQMMSELAAPLDADEADFTYAEYIFFL